MGAPSQGGLCSPKCRFFICKKRALRPRGNSMWCAWTGDECNPAICNYAACAKRRLLPNGVCAMTVKRRTVERGGPEREPKIGVKVRGKLFKKMGEKILY